MGAFDPERGLYQPLSVRCCPLWSPRSTPLAMRLGSCAWRTCSNCHQSCLRQPLNAPQPIGAMLCQLPRPCRLHAIVDGLDISTLFRLLLLPMCLAVLQLLGNHQLMIWHLKIPYRDTASHVGAARPWQLSFSLQLFRPDSCRSPLQPPTSDIVIKEKTIRHLGSSASSQRDLSPRMTPGPI